MNCHRKYTVNEKYFDQIDTQYKAYFLGLLYADGCNNKNGSIEISLQEKDKDILEIFARELNYNGPLSCRQLNNVNINWQNSFRLSICNRYMSNRLVNLGIVHNKSLILKFPTFDQVPEYLINHFIRGYFDGDGCISVHNKNDKYKDKITLRKYCTVSFVSSKDFCEGFCSFIKYKFNINLNYRKTNSKIYCVSITNKKTIKIFLDWIYNDSNIYLLRKYNKYIESNNISKKKVREINLHPNIEDIKNLYLSGESANKLSKIYGITDTTIVKQLKYIGIRTRNIKESLKTHYSK